MNNLVILKVDSEIWVMPSGNGRIAHRRQDFFRLAKLTGDRRHAGPATGR